MTSLLKRLLGSAPTAPRSERLDGEELARQLEKLEGYRVLRALDLSDGFDELPPLAEDERIAVVVDSETTGLDPAQDRMVEIAAQRFAFDRRGRITKVERVRSWLEDPGQPLPERVAQLTGLADADVLEKAFDDTEIVSRLSTADIIVAHNAGFDRPFVDRRFPQLRDRPWGCSLSQLDWLKLGFDGRALGHLLLQSGLYFDGHRAANDVVALTALLGREVPDGRTIFSHLLERCFAESVRIEAVGSPFEAKDALRRRGYRWDPNGRFWWTELQKPDLESEMTWLEEAVYSGRGRPRLRVITARERFADPG
jgi:DNA polymerase-3 subunit epsilon